MKVMARRGIRTLRQRFAPNRLMAWQQTDQRRLWRRRRAMISLLALLALLPGCRGHRQSLHVLVVPTDRMEWLREAFRDQRDWEPLRQEFQRIHPNVDLQITLGSESDVKETLRKGQSRGLGPDLLLSRGAVAISLLEAGLVRAIPDTPSLRESLKLVGANDLKRVNGPRGLAGLPMFSEITLACFDRRRLRQAPTNVDDLLAMAASGKPIGLAVEPISLWWSAGALGANTALASAITGEATTIGDSNAKDRAAIEAWLVWLRQVSLQSQVDLASGPQDLTEGLESGRLAWIPCYSLALRRLERSMGANLGVAPLPKGAGGLPTPSSSIRVWSLGVDSSPRQRELALALAQLSLNPLVQRQLTLGTKMVIPANRFVPIPVASSGRLAAIEKAREQFNQTSSLLVTPYSSDRLQRVVPMIETLISQVMAGVLTPQQGTDALMRLRPHR